MAEAQQDPRQLAGHIDPAALLRNDGSDIMSLLIVWYLRKSTVGLLALGLIVLALATNSADVQLEDGPFGRPGDLFTAAGVIELAVLLRLACWALEKAMAYPLTLRYEATLQLRTSFGHEVGVLMDRWRLASSFGLLRFSHHVRHEALRRLGPVGRRVGLLDPVMDTLNILLWIAAFAVLFAVAAANAD